MKLKPLIRLVWVAFLVAIWPIYGLILIPFYPIAFPSFWWYMSRLGMLGVAVFFAFLTALLLNKVFEG